MAATATLATVARIRAKSSQRSECSSGDAVLQFVEGADLKSSHRAHNRSTQRDFPAKSEPLVAVGFLWVSDSSKWMRARSVICLEAARHPIRHRRRI